jgi:hypothetical protein
LPSQRISTQKINPDDHKKHKRTRKSSIAAKSIYKRKKMCLTILGITLGLCSLVAVGTALGIVYGMKSNLKNKKLLLIEKSSFK